MIDPDWKPYLDSLVFPASVSMTAKSVTLWMITNPDSAQNAHPELSIIEKTHKAADATCVPQIAQILFYIPLSAASLRSWAS